MFEKILSSKSKTAILKIFFRCPSRDYTFKELTEQTRFSYGTVYPALVSLTDARILTTRKVGRSILYSLNQRHPFFEELKQIFIAERKKLFEIVRETVAKIKKKGIKTIVLFGSLARGEALLKSDIDILIFHTLPISRIDRIKNNVEVSIKKTSEKYDVVIVPTYLSVKEARRRKKKFDKFILNILAEGKTLYGDLKWLEK